MSETTHPIGATFFKSIGGAQRVKIAQGTVKTLMNSNFSSDLTLFAIIGGSVHYWGSAQLGGLGHSQKILSYAPVWTPTPGRNPGSAPG